MTDDEKTPPIRLTRNFETSKYQNDQYKPELILHPSEQTSNADLLIEVVKNNELQAIGLRGEDTVPFLTKKTIWDFRDSFE